MDRGASWLQSMRLQRVKHNRVTNTFTFSYICIYMHIGEGNDNPLQYSSLENPMDSREAWWATVCGGHKESDMTDRLTLHFIYTHTCILFQILFPYRLLQDIEQSSLRCTGEAFYLFVLYLVQHGCSVVSNLTQPRELQPIRLLCPRKTVVCVC